MTDSRITPQSAYLERVHYPTAFIGGYIGMMSLTLLSQFGNAQTVNMINLVVKLVGGNLHEVLLRFLGVLAYMLGVAFATYLPEHTKADCRYLSLVITAFAAVFYAWMPEGLNPLIGVYPAFFAMAFQWTSYGPVFGYACSTIFSSNNTRQFAASLTEVFLNHKPEFRLKARLFGCTLLSYHLGVAAGAVIRMNIGRSFPLFLLPVLVLSAINMSIRPKGSES